MTKITLFIACFFISMTMNAQMKISGTTSILPAGTYIKDGKVTLSTGYELIYSDDKTIVSVKKKKGGDVSGSYSCGCGTGSGTCTVSSSGTLVTCKGSSCCGLVVTSNTVKMSSSVFADSTIKWNSLVIPKTTTSTSNKN